MWLHVHVAQPSSALGGCQGQVIPPPGGLGEGDVKPPGKACHQGGPCLAWGAWPPAVVAP